MIAARLDLDTLPQRITARPNHGYSATGYGRKIPTRTMVQLPGSARWRRVYVCCYSNAGTCYVDTPAGWIVLY